VQNTGASGAAFGFYLFCLFLSIKFLDRVDSDNMSHADYALKKAVSTEKKGFLNLY